MTIILNAGPKSMEKNNVSETTLSVCLYNQYGYQGSFIHNKLKKVVPKAQGPLVRGLEEVASSPIMERLIPRLEP